MFAANLHKELLRKKIKEEGKMKKSVLLMVSLMMIVPLMVVAAGCMAPPVDSEFSSDLSRPHELRKMFEKDVNFSEADSSFSAGFFLFFGGASGSSHSESGTITIIRFAWEDKDSIYVITDLPLKRVRVKIVDQIEVPTVQFFLQRPSPEYNDEYYHTGTITKAVFDDDQEKFWRNYLSYALITCEADDWPEAIKLPLN